MTVLRHDNRSASVGYEKKDVLPKSDFLLYYSVFPEAMGMTHLCYRAPGEDGFFLLIVSPKVEPTSSAVIPKDLVLVLDKSGSMVGEKIAQAKEALAFVLRYLNAEDRFAVIAFSDIAEAPSELLIPVTPESVESALAWVETIEADGGEERTSIRPSQRPFLSSIRPGGRVS